MIQEEAFECYLSTLSSAADFEIETIDYQHHYFFKLAGRILESLREGQDSGYLRELLSELNEFAKFHFRSEERLMKFVDYPDYENHRKEHMDLLQKLSINEGELSLEFTEEKIHQFFKFLTNWFKNHTETVDKKFVDYLVEHPTYQNSPNLF